MRRWDCPLPMVIDPDATPNFEQKGLGGMYWL